MQCSDMGVFLPKPLHGAEGREAVLGGRASRRLATDDEISSCRRQHQGSHYAREQRTRIPALTIPGLGYLPHEDENPAAEARLLYVAMTRAIDPLILTNHKESRFVRQLKHSIFKAACNEQGYADCDRPHACCARALQGEAWRSARVDCTRGKVQTVDLSQEKVQAS